MQAFVLAASVLSRYGCVIILHYNWARQMLRRLFVYLPTSAASRAAAQTLQVAKVAVCYASWR